MAARSIALFRGINVGTAKSVAMADLAAVFDTLGCTAVTTILRSGNVVFEGTPPTAKAIEGAVLARTGVRSSVLVLDAKTFRRIADADPLGSVATDGSKHFVTFLSEAHGTVEVPDEELLAPELLRVGDEAIYQWFPEGSLQTTVPKSFWKQFGGHVTARNRNTVDKLLVRLEK